MISPELTLYGSSGRKMGRGNSAAAQKKDTDMNINANNIAKASLTAIEAASFLPLAAQAAIKGKAEIDSAKAKGAAALAVMVAGFASDEILERPWSFDITVKGDVHTHVGCTGLAEFGGTEGTWRYNAEGAVSRDAQSAYRAAFQQVFFNLPENNNAVWTMASKAVPMALAIRAEGMTAKIVDGVLVLEGGTGEKAEALRGAKSLSALAKVAKGEAGTNRAAPSNAKGAEGEARVATPAEVLALAARLCEGAAKGEEALSGTALSFARKIAAIVAANPDAFTDD
jgi:hypothetical protein